jgi:hypothetical protein
MKDEIGIAFAHIAMRCYTLVLNLPPRGCSGQLQKTMQPLPVTSGDELQPRPTKRISRGIRSYTIPQGLSLMR